MKLIKKLSGLAIGLSLICVSQLMYQHSQKHYLKLLNYKPIQIKIERNRSHISKDFYLEFDAQYDLVLTKSAIKATKNKIATPSIKTEITVNDRKIDTYQPELDSCIYPVCRIGFFKGVANQKHTIVMDVDISGINSYNLDPVIEARVSMMYAVKGYKVNEDLKSFSLLVIGIAILTISIMILAIEFITQKYNNK